MFVVLDELNKYAPRDGDSPIKQILLDVAERGRSLGVILIGAQQTASEVERRILANCAIRVAGRLDAAEAERPEYGFLPPAQRARAMIAKPGTMFIAQPDIPVPLAVDFPFPAWATRPSEQGVWAGVDDGPSRAVGPVRHHPRRPRRPAALLRDAFPISAVPSVRNPGEFDIGPLASALTHWTERNATRGCTGPRVTGGTRELSLKRSKCCDRVRCFESAVATADVDLFQDVCVGHSRDRFVDGLERASKVSRC